MVRFCVAICFQMDTVRIRRFGNSGPRRPSVLRMASVAQLVRALGCGPRCRGFESRRSPHLMPMTSGHRPMTMKKSRKPVRKCHACPLNLGEYCWIYQYPRGQWRGEKHCAGYSDRGLHARFEEWCKEPSVKTRKELRREFFRTRRRTELHREFAAGRAAANRRARRRAGRSGGEGARA